MNRYNLNPNSGSKGQSFVELSLVVLLLMLLVAGIAEFGVLLNRYLNLLDGAREAARYGANYDPFAPCAPDVNGVVAPSDSDGVCPLYYQGASKEATNVVNPIVMDATGHDDIVISILIVAPGHFCRFPSEDGWSWSQVIKGQSTPNHISAQPSATSIQGQMTNGAPLVSALLVELFYNYHQTLKAPFFEQFFPDPIPVYTYAIMPLKNANPPSGPCHQ